MAMVILSTLVRRFSVSCIRDFFPKKSENIFSCFAGGKNSILLFFPIKEISLWPELSSLPHFIIKGGPLSVTDEGRRTKNRNPCFWYRIDSENLTGFIPNFPGTYMKASKKVETPAYGQSAAKWSRLKIQLFIWYFLQEFIELNERDILWNTCQSFLLTM